LLEIEPDLAAWLTVDEQRLARRLLVPTVQLGVKSPELDHVLERSNASTALLMDGRWLMPRLSSPG
jgi:hypothetical protein